MKKALGSTKKCTGLAHEDGLFHSPTTNDLRNLMVKPTETTQHTLFFYFIDSDVTPKAVINKTSFIPPNSRNVTLLEKCHAAPSFAIRLKIPLQELLQYCFCEKHASWSFLPKEIPHNMIGML